MEHAPGSLSRRTSRSEYSQYKPTGVGSRGESARHQPPLNEKQSLRGLNDRLAGFIEKVHQLERQNQLLEGEIEETRGRAKPASRLEQEYGPELGRLRQLVRDVTHQKHRIEIEREFLEGELGDLRRQHEQEARSRAGAESGVLVLKKDIGDARLAKEQLDQKAQSLLDEIRFLKRNHEAEVKEMLDQIQDAQVSVRAHDFGDSGVTAALRDIRAQLEGQEALFDSQQAGETFRSQFAKLTEAAEAKREALKVSQQEIQEYRKRLQAKNIEMDCAKGTREAMERQLHDVEDRHKEEIIHYQNKIKELENELINCKFDMSGYLREYQDLLNVKMALDVEIMSYRKLLCGEEARLSSMSDTHMSLPYIYHQSPVYTLPSLSQAGGPHRRVEPQYKFVEEIITETTREIEMSEFEETGSEGSEGSEVGRDEQGCNKRGRRGSEEEEGDKKDGEDDEGEQESGGQQNRVESNEEDVVGVDGRGPGGVGDGEKSKKETEETEALDNKEDTGLDANTQSNVQFIGSLDKEENEQHPKDAENAKQEKEDVLRVEPVHKDLPSKPEPVVPVFPVEGEKENAEKADLRESLAPVQEKKSIEKASTQESKESDKTPELSSSVQEKDKTLVTETAEEPKSSVPKQTEDPSENKAQNSAGITLRNEEKDQGLSESKENCQSGALKDEGELAGSIKDAKEDADKGQGKEMSDVKSLPEAGDQKPKENVTADVGASRREAAESSPVQKSKQREGPENTDDPQGKTEKAESKSEE